MSEFPFTLPRIALPLRAFNEETSGTAVNAGVQTEDRFAVLLVWDDTDDLARLVLLVFKEGEAPLSEGEGGSLVSLRRDRLGPVGEAELPSAPF